LGCMGKRGPKPRPTVLKGLRGTLRTPDRRRGPDAMAPAGKLVPPKYFTPAMRKRWRQIIERAPLNILRPVDEGFLVDYVINEAMAEQAWRECNGKLTVEAEKGITRNPLLMVYHKAVEAKRAAADRLGFSPSARVGLPIDDGAGLGTTAEEERWAELAKGMWRPDKFHPGTRIPTNEPRPSKRLARKLRQAEKAEALAKAEPEGEA
jgi:phage terminase small subunit